MVEGTNIIDPETNKRYMEKLGEKRARPDFVGRTTQESIKYYDDNARKAFYKGNYFSGTVNWVGLQFAKLGPRSWLGLGLMVAGGVSSGGALLGRTNLLTRGTVGFGKIIGGKTGEVLIKQAPGIISKLQPVSKIGSMVNRHIKNEQDYANARSRPNLESKNQNEAPVNTSRPPLEDKSQNEPTKQTNSGPKVTRFNVSNEPSAANVLSRDTMNEIMQKGVYVPGVWGDEIKGQSKFDINNIKQPELSPKAMNEIMQKGVYVPGVWGEEINRTGTSGISPNSDMPKNPFAKPSETSPSQSGLSGPSDARQPQLSRDTMNEIMQKGVYVPGVWGDEIKGQSKFDINNIKQPELSPKAMNEIMQKGVYVPGVWGEEINRTGTSGISPNSDMPKNPFAKPSETSPSQSGLSGPNPGMPDLKTPSESLNKFKEYTNGWRENLNTQQIKTPDIPSNPSASGPYPAKSPSELINTPITKIPDISSRIGGTPGTQIGNSPSSPQGFSPSNIGSTPGTPSNMGSIQSGSPGNSPSSPPSSISGIQGSSPISHPGAPPGSSPGSISGLGCASVSHQGSSPGSSPSGISSIPGSSPGSPQSSIGSTPGTPSNPIVGISNTPSSPPGSPQSNIGNLPGPPQSSISSSPGIRQDSIGGTPSSQIGSIGSTPGISSSHIGGIGNNPGSPQSNIGSTPNTPSSQFGRTPGGPPGSIGPGNQFGPRKPGSLF